MMGLPARSLIPVFLLVVAACGMSPVPTQSPSATVTPTPTALNARPTPTIEPTPTPELTLRVDGMATVTVDGLRQVVDPAHPNQNRRLNAQLGTIDAGERVLLIETVRIRDVTYWEVARDRYWMGSLGWVRHAGSDSSNLEPFQPACPTEFPLTAASIVALGTLEALSCFGDTELTLTGTLNCDRAIGDFIVGGASFLDPNRHCSLDGQFSVAGEAVTSLLDNPTTVDLVSGRFLIRGHFDDPEAQNCSPIPFGTHPGPGNIPAEPGAVMVCRRTFVAGSVTMLD